MSSQNWKKEFDGSRWESLTVNYKKIVGADYFSIETPIRKADHFQRIKRGTIRIARNQKKSAATFSGKKSALYIVNNFLVKSAYARANKRNPENVRIAALDAISAVVILWSGKLPSKLPENFTLSDIKRFFHAALSFESAHHFRDVSSNGFCTPAIPMGKSKKARGLRGEFIRTTFETHLSGMEKILAIEYFCNGRTLSSIGADYGTNKQAIQRQVKRLTVKLQSGAIANALCSIIDDDVSKSYSLNEGLMIEYIDRFDTRTNYIYEE